MAQFAPNSFLVEESASIRDALAAIDQNKYGLIFICDQACVVLGMLTDGDIRRALLTDVDLSEKVSAIANKDFVSATPSTTREHLLKLLDGRVKSIPILEDGKLVDVVTRELFPASEEKEIHVRSKAPVRVSFGGGGSDLTHFFEKEKGAVLNAAISLYAHAHLTRRADGKIRIQSSDLNAELNANNLDEAICASGDFGLFQALLSVVRPDFGFNLYVYSDFGVGSGLGGSASVAVAVLGCFNALRRDEWTRYEIAELAFQAERLFLGVAGGWQDQYAAAFGGINFIEFSATKNIVTPLAISDDIKSELQERLVLCNTGISHVSGNIHNDQKKEMAKGEKKELVKLNVEITHQLKEALVSGNLNLIGTLMHEGWMIKRQLSSKISSNNIDGTYNDVIASGALGGKLLGAGGGGYFLFFVEGQDQFRVRARISELGLEIQHFNFDEKGLCTWKTRV